MKGSWSQGAGQRGQAPRMPSGHLTTIPAFRCVGPASPCLGGHTSLARSSAFHLGNRLCWWPELTRITCKLGPNGPLQGGWACEGHAAEIWVEWMPCESAIARSRWTWVRVFCGESRCVPLCRFLLEHGQLVWVVLCSHKALPVLVSPGQPLHPLMTCLTCWHLVSCLGNLLSSALWTSTMLVAKRGHRTYKARGAAPA